MSKNTSDVYVSAKGRILLLQCNGETQKTIRELLPAPTFNPPHCSVVQARVVFRNTSLGA